MRRSIVGALAALVTLAVVTGILAGGPASAGVEGVIGSGFGSHTSGFLTPTATGHQLAPDVYPFFLSGATGWSSTTAVYSPSDGGQPMSETAHLTCLSHPDHGSAFGAAIITSNDAFDITSVVLDGTIYRTSDPTGVDLVTVNPKRGPPPGSSVLTLVDGRMH